MHPNDVQLISVFAREKGQHIQSKLVTGKIGFEIVAQARSGNALFGTGARYRMMVTLRNLTSPKNIAFEACLGPGNFGDSQWATPSLSHVFEVPRLESMTRPHICEIIAVLEVGIAAPNITFATSAPLMLI
ncbi:MAG: hypothetical protein KC547_22985 [Anaerolineae bacterium]|nr:hypothetical protein [Anaerolineae bacterium]